MYSSSSSSGTSSATGCAALLTIVGLVVAILAFGLLQTVVDAWYAGADMASAHAPGHAQRHLARVPAAGLLPRAHPLDRRRAAVVDLELVRRHLQGPVVRQLLRAVRRGPGHYFDLYPEFVADARAAGRLEGATAAARWSAGCSPTPTAGRWATPSPLKGTIYPGNWEFTVRGIYEPQGRDHRHAPDVLPLGVPQRAAEEALPAPRASSPASSSCRSPTARAPPRSARRSTREFRNSLAETLTETEKAFQLGFVAQTETDRDRDPHRLLRGDRHHLRGGGQHHGDDRARAPRRVRDPEGPRLRARLRRGADRRRVADDDADRRRRSASRSPSRVAAGLQDAARARCSRCSTCPARRSRCRRLRARRGVLAALVPAMRASRVRIVDGLRHIG